MTKFEKYIHMGIERVMAFASPAAAIRRAHTRRIYEFGYDAATPGRARGTGKGALNNSASESPRNQIDRVKLMWEARDLANNYSFIKSVLIKEAMYVCGALKYQANTGDPMLDGEIETYLESWMKTCDVTGRHVFRQLIQLAHMSMRRDGDVGFIIVGDGEEIKLQTIESDRIGNPFQMGTTQQSQPQYIAGFTIDELGRVVSVRVFERTLVGQYTNEQEIPADSFIHYFDPMRADQYRGVTCFETVIPHARDLYELLQMEKMAVKWGASHAGIIRKSDPAIPQWNGSNGPEGPVTTPGGTPLEKIEPGKIIRLLPGEDVTMFSTQSRPSSTFDGFIVTLVREMANGLCLPFSFVWDMSGLGGATSRIELAMAQRAFQRQQNLLVEQVLNKIKDLVIGRAIAFGKLPAAPETMQGRWQFPAHITADEGYQAQADLALLQMGLKTRTQIFAERGLDFEDETITLATEVQHYQQVAAQTGVPIELMTQGLPMASQMLAQMGMAEQATQAGQTAPGPPEEEEESKGKEAKEEAAT